MLPLRSVHAVKERRRAWIMVVCGLIVLALNIVEATDRGTTVWNIVTIATGAFLLFYGFVVIGRPPAD
jgi:uncharacterized membrane protein HdeD (DUF308 family)